MSSHREAPEISKDPVADSTDVYAFVSPDHPDTVTLIANYIPFEAPDGGPNFFEFGPDVLYEIHIDNDGDAVADITYQFEFTNQLQNRESFLYNTGPIRSLDDPNWNSRQVYSITMLRENAFPTVLGTNLASPPCHVGPRSTPDYAALAASAIHTLPDGSRVFAGQRADGFYVDLGSVFDLADLRPFQNLHLIPTPATPGVNGLAGANVHSIALQVPMRLLTQDGNVPGGVAASNATIGVWTSASRQTATLRLEFQGQDRNVGPWVQVSRLGNPLFNEVIVPLGKKDYWNALPPIDDAQFSQYVLHPELAKLLPILYPGVFPNLAAYGAPRADLAAILLTGIPAGIIPGFQNVTGARQADMLRLNMAIPPASSPKPLGILDGDLAGFPNGRRPMDDIVTIELRAVAGVTIPLVDKSFKPDGAAALVTDGVSARDVGVPYASSFPYLGLPNSGYDVPPLPAPLA